MENEGSRKAEKGLMNDMWLWKSLFSTNSKSRGADNGDSVSPKEDHHISFLSPIANSVVSRCTKILGMSGKELQNQFDVALPDNVKQPLSHAKNFLEFCSYKTLHHQVITGTNYLNDKEFRRLTFDMMLAWEVPGVDTEQQEDKESASCSNQNAEDEDGWSLFYSNSTKTAVEVDDKKTVGPEAFARIAPACPVIADTITVHNLFDALTSSSGPRLHFLVYDKYLRSLEKVTKSAQKAVGQHQLISNLSLAEDEIILDIDGTIPTQPVLQHIGMSAWPGRLTLTNYALYFEAGVGIYDKAVRYDLAKDMKQVIKPELTGPLGARIFDKAVMYKSSAITEPVYLEFPEFKGCSRRDYWLDICLEILRAHKFIRKYNIINKENQQTEALARGILGIFRYRAVRESYRISLSNYKTLLCFNLAESLPGGDMILETLLSRLTLISTERRIVSSSPNAKIQQQLFPNNLYTLRRLGITSSKEEEANIDGETTFLGGGDVCAGELNALESVVKQLKLNTGRAEAAQATVDQVKVEGIDTNLAVMKELLFPLIETFNWLQRLASWEDPFKSVIFVVFFSYMILRDWIKFMLPSIFVFLALVMLWRKKNPNKSAACKNIIAPPSKNAVEQLLSLQEAITQVETLIQSGNIILLKIRALLFAVAPQATTNKLALLLSFMAVVIAMLPLKYLIFVVFIETFTMSMPLRKESSDRRLRRSREWWTRIPAAPVQLVKPD